MKRQQQRKRQRRGTEYTERRGDNTTRMLSSFSMQNLMQAIPGAEQLFDWFGYWPTFHDAEVLSLELNRTGPSKVRVHAFRMTNELDPRGFYRTDKHCIVTFLIEDITAMGLREFNHQNVLVGLTLRNDSGEFVLSFSSSFGLEGDIKARTVRVELAPGVPGDSQYKEQG